MTFARKHKTTTHKGIKPMFIQKLTRGYYDRNGQQKSGKGLYLALFSWNKFKAMDEARNKCLECQLAKHAYEFNTHVRVHMDHQTFKQAYDAYTTCSNHRAIGIDPPEKYSDGHDVLYACVRQCALSQFGHWMMGTIRISGASITVSGPIGSDGLPLDLQKCPEAYRDKLVRVPEDIAKVYWSNKGHNDIEGNAAKVLREWALGRLSFLQSEKKGNRQFVGSL